MTTRPIVLELGAERCRHLTGLSFGLIIPYHLLKHQHTLSLRYGKLLDVSQFTFNRSGSYRRCVDCVCRFL